jgi:uncharacterized protein
VREGDNPLDRTRIHPDHYALAAKLLERASATPDTITRSEELAALRERIATLDIPATAKELETPEVLVWDTLESLKALDQDPREEFPRPIFKRGLLRIEDLEAGMELKGTILNVVDFGAFVDIGLKDSGLVHISQLANRYVKSPHDVVSVGDVVSVWIMSVDRDRKRVSLTMIRPGTERPRTERADRGLRRGGAKGDAGPARARDDRRGPRPSQRREPGPGTASPQTAGGPSTGGTSEGRPAQPAQPRPGTNRIPGPPLRMQQGRGRGGFGRGGQGGAQGRTGSAAKGQGQGSGRPETDSAGEKAPKPKPAASKSPAPLSPSAISGNAPLRSFEQLKQFFDIRAKPEEEAAASQPASPDTAPETQEPPVEASHASTEAPPAAEGPQESTGV